MPGDTKGGTKKRKPRGADRRPISITSVRTLLEQLEKGNDDSKLFRGQNRDWPLVPSIGRYPIMALAFGGGWREFHDSLIYDFLRLGHPHLAGYSIKGTDSWVLGQHFGLPTRLLDATTNPLKALFFSVNHPAEDSNDGVVWAVSYTAWREDLDEESREFWDVELVPFLPAQMNPRLIAQEGAFLSYPLPKTSEPLLPMDRLPKRRELSFKKFVIPASSKGHLRRELELLGIKSRLLFPDLEGVAHGIRLELEDNCAALRATKLLEASYEK